MQKKNYITYIALALFAFFALTGNSLYDYLHQATGFASEPVTIVVKPGMSLTKLSGELETQQIIIYPKFWTLYARGISQDQIKAGEYLVNPKSTPLELLDQFTTGDVVEHQLTLIEGWNFKQMLNELHQVEKLELHLKGLSNEEIMKRLDLGGKHPEGLFFPDSYRYVAGTTDLEILKKANKRLNRVLEEEWQKKEEGLPYETSYEALIMASIVEKETGQAYERSQIAGVFVRRLNKSMRLQTDPTVIYGLGDKYKGNLTRKHLKQPSPYNTYTNSGLPPTPIALVGRAAIHAALHPASGSSLYFVAKGDGSHFFSDTLDEHNNAVRQYQLKRKSSYRSAPQK